MVFFKTKPDKKKDMLFFRWDLDGPADGEASLGIVQVEAKAGDTYYQPPSSHKK